MKTCGRCDREFNGTKSQLYCSTSCRLAANEEAAARRREDARRLRRKAAEKRCTVCGATLSMYGHGNTCAAHISLKPLSDVLKQIRKKT
jgi:hypothetical protein